VALSNFIVRGLCCYGAGCLYVLTRQLFQSTSAVVSHKQQCADSGKVLVVVYNRRWSD